MHTVLLTSRSRNKAHLYLITNKCPVDKRLWERKVMWFLLNSAVPCTRCLEKANLSSSCYVKWCGPSAFASLKPIFPLSTHCASAIIPFVIFPPWRRVLRNLHRRPVNGFLIKRTIYSMVYLLILIQIYQIYSISLQIDNHILQFLNWNATGIISPKT